MEWNVVYACVHVYLWSSKNCKWDMDFWFIIVRDRGRNLPGGTAGVSVSSWWDPVLKPVLIVTSE